MRFFGREIRFVAGDARPKQDGDIHGIVMRGASHECELGADIVADALQLGFVLRPCNDIAVTPDRTVALGMRFIEVEVDPLLVDCVGPAVLREGIHIPGRAFELAKCFVVVVQKNVLVVEVRTVEQ